jgi:hypothetical protein
MLALFLSVLIQAAPIKVMVIDTGFTKSSYTAHKVHAQGNDTHARGHGTAVVHTLLYGGFTKEGKAISPVCNDVEVYMCGNTSNFPKEVLTKCFTEALNSGIKYMNLSMGGTGRFYPEEYELLKQLTERGVNVVISAGNDRENLNEKTIYPQGYSLTLKNVKVIGAYDVRVTNYGWWVDIGYSGIVVAPNNTGALTQHSGTSFASPKYLNKLLREECAK